MTHYCYNCSGRLLYGSCPVCSHNDFGKVSAGGRAQEAVRNTSGLRGADSALGVWGRNGSPNPSARRKNKGARRDCIMSTQTHTPTKAKRRRAKKDALRERAFPRQPESAQESVVRQNAVLNRWAFGIAKGLNKGK